MIRCSNQIKYKNKVHHFLKKNHEIYKGRKSKIIINKQKIKYIKSSIDGYDYLIYLLPSLT